MPYKMSPSHQPFTALQTAKLTIKTKDGSICSYNIGKGLCILVIHSATPYNVSKGLCILVIHSAAPYYVSKGLCILVIHFATP